MNLVPNKQLLLNVPIQPTKERKKKFCEDTKIQETIGVVSTFQPRKRLVSTTVRSAKPAATF